MVELEPNVEEAAPSSSSSVWFVCCVSNPVGYRSRIALYNRFVRHVRSTLRAKLCVVECVYGRADGDVHTLDPNDVELGPASEKAPIALHVKTSATSVLWHKENLLNVGIRAVREADPGEGSRYIVWADADVEFVEGRQAVVDIVKALQDHPVVQAFGTCMDGGPAAGEVLKLDHSFMMSHAYRMPKRSSAGQTFWHSGYVWAARSDFIEACGGLFDLGVLGAGDRMMAQAFVRDLGEYERHRGERGDFEAVIAWGRRVADELERAGQTAGYAPCVIRHGFHGHKNDRQYNSRAAILVRHAFDATTDVTRNAQGLLEWVKGDGRVDAMAKEVLDYFSSRNEDA